MNTSSTTTGTSATSSSPSKGQALDAADQGGQAHRGRAFRIAAQLVEEGIIGMDEASAGQRGRLGELMFPASTKRRPPPA